MGGLDGGTGRWRTPGLRRDELGKLAGLSAGWISWLEQGRDIELSASAAQPPAGERPSPSAGAAKEANRMPSCGSSSTEAKPSCRALMIFARSSALSVIILGVSAATGMGEVRDTCKTHHSPFGPASNACPRRLTLLDARTLRLAH